MPIGIIISPLSIFLGGLIGTLFGSRLSAKIQYALPMAFSLAAMGMGVKSLIVMHSMPAVILSLILGTTIGALCDIEGVIKRVGRRAASVFMKSMHNDPEGHKKYLELFTIAAILFCTGPTGIYGAMQAALSDDQSILMTKAVLDLFTAAIFASTLGMAASFLAIPVFCIFFFFASIASVISPWISPAMFADFSGCGGLLILATGFRMAEIKIFHVADMLPALVLVIPVSHLWSLLPL